MYPGCFGKATPGTPGTGPARAGRVAPERACKGPVVRRMQSKSDATSAPFMKSSRNCTEQKRLHILIKKIIIKNK